ncbi:MAG: tyrosine-type recombinase/integrase [Gammaproteobacteria bacterium]|nr:tyrosine-type recombinase/integrase [Gammaproteobacteria bacterium]
MQATTKPSFHLRKPKNIDQRDREHLTEHEINKLMQAARNSGRHGHRDSTMILIAYRHGLRVSELVRLKWSQVDLFQNLLHVSRLKNGINSTHPLAGVEIRALRKLQRDYPETDFVFISERKAPLTDHTFRKIIERAGRVAKLKLKIHPHMLRHSTGFKLANDGNDTRSIQLYLGHSSIQNTTRYTMLSSKRFEKFWQD